MTLRESYYLWAELGRLFEILYGIDVKSTLLLFPTML